jgi:ABC-2 type transport system ATP-binding protein
VVLDEPTAGMDVEARASTRDLMGRLRDSGVTILLTSHDLTDVERLADRVAIIDRGRIVALGGPEELASGAIGVLRLRLSVALTEPDRQGLETRIGDGRGAVMIVEDGGSGRYRIEGVTPDPAVIARIAEWCAQRGAMIVELRTGGATLEERYLELIGAAGAGDEDDAEPAARPTSGRGRGRTR